MNVFLNKKSVEAVGAFIVSPFLSLPVILNRIKKKNIVGIYLFSFLVALISYIYIPSFTNDRTRYFERYEIYQTINFSQLFSYLMSGARTDFLFDMFIYLFAKVGINVQFLFFFFTYVSVFIILFVWHKVISIQVYSNRIYFLSFLSIILSFSLPTLFSGIRFFFGLSFFLLGLYYLYVTRNITKAVLSLAFAIFTHFSLAYFLPAVLIVLFWKNNTAHRILFIISLLFLFLPSSVLSGFLQLINLPESYSAKVDDYVLGGDVTMQEAEGNSWILYYIRLIWMVLGYIYLLFVRRNSYNKTLSSLVYLFIFFYNLTSSVPTIFLRYASLIKILLVLLVATDYYYIRKKTPFYWGILLFSIIFVTDVFVLRNNFMSSLLDMKNISLLTIFFNKVTLLDVLY